MILMNALTICVHDQKHSITNLFGLEIAQAIRASFRPPHSTNLAAFQRKADLLFTDLPHYNTKREKHKQKHQISIINKQKKRCSAIDIMSKQMQNCAGSTTACSVARSHVFIRRRTKLNGLDSQFAVCLVWYCTNKDYLFRPTVLLGEGGVSSLCKFYMLKKTRFDLYSIP